MYTRAGVRLTTWSLILTVFNVGLSVGVVIAVGMLLYFQLRSVIRNRTGIEDWILDKAIYRRKQIMKAAENDAELQVDPFVYPYDLGSAKNLVQVVNFSCIPVGDGVEWPVVDGCDQYTLTVRKTIFDDFLNSFLTFSVSKLPRKLKNVRGLVGTKSLKKFPDLGCHCGLKATKSAFIHLSLTNLESLSKLETWST